MKHFITGGSGFFGLHLIHRLLNAGQNIVVFDRAPLDPEYLKKGVQFFQGDIRDTHAVKKAMRGCDVLHHNAAVLPISRSGKIFREINVEGTRRVLEVVREIGVRKSIFISTSAVYGIPSILPITETTPLTPLGEYGWSKFEAEQVVREMRSTHTGLDISIVRPRTIVGTGRLGIFGILFDWIVRGKCVYIIGQGNNLFQLLSAPDLADACWLISSTPCNNEDFNIGAEVYSTVRLDLEALIRHANTTARIQPTNAFLVRTILGMVDHLHISPLVDWHYKTPHKPFYFDIAKAKTMLGWHPKDSNVSMLTDTYDWYLRHKDTVALSMGTTHRKNVKQGILKMLRTFS